MRGNNVLHIAEKNSIAKQVANILSQGTRRTGHTLSKYNPVFHFQRDGNQHTFSSVRGHLFDYELPPECKNWGYFDNSKILTREVAMVKKVNEDMKDLLKNLQKLAGGNRELVLWLDCDRQGEAIAFEVIDVIRGINPRISILRARFAAVTRVDIMRAYNNLIDPNKRQADAVNYRIQMDFRMGCAFTRFQTLTFAKAFRAKDHMVISYGPCQMPTLNFVVTRYLQILYFKPQKYWLIKANIILTQRSSVQLKWERNNTRDQEQANILFYQMFNRAHQGEGRIVGQIMQRNKNDKKRYRPYPLTTVSFQKLATDKLKLSSAQAMKIAQKLYQQGYISYPRTQTNGFPSTMNLQSLIQKVANCPDYQNYAYQLINGKYMKPKVGQGNDNAHTPIHPVKPADPNSLSRNQWRVYDLISRHFLACCSKDAEGVQSEIVAEIGGERFRASHLSIKHKNYLQIYPFDRWVESDFPGEIPEQFQAQVQLAQNSTKPPGYLTQSDLITMMQRNQIGTDATIHQHIETIQNRKYAFKKGSTFKPTNLGAALIVTNKQLGLQLQGCHIRRMIEERMDKIAEGQIQKNNAAISTLGEVGPLFGRLKSMEGTWMEEMKKAMEEHSQLHQIQMEGGGGGGGQDRNNNQGDQEPGNNDNNSRGIVCYKCRQPGHTANNCPQNGNRPRGNQPKSRPKQKPNQHNTSSSNTIVCYVCREPGHLSSECPNKNRAQRAQQNNQQTRRFQCFICHQEGHMAPNCPNKQNKTNSTGISSMTNSNQGGNSGNNCYSCGQPGHYSSNCPNKNKQQFTNNHQKKQKKRCPTCGVQGRHPRGSSCVTVRKKNRSQTEQDY